MDTLPLRPVKITLWIYFWLLLLEGVLRKWIVPQWSDYIFIARDPLVLITYLLAWRAGIFPRRPAMVVIWLFGVLSLAFSLAGEAPFIVTLFGLRTNYLHLPLIFVMEAALTRRDVLRFGRWIMIVSLPIVVLMLLQFNAAPESILNVAVGGGEAGQIRGAMGKIRPPGPFSFISGTICYCSLLAAFVVHGWLQANYRNVVLIFATVALIVAAPISISRALVLALGIVLLFALPVLLRDYRRIPQLLGPAVAALGLIASLADTVYIRAFLTRWDETMTADNAGFYGSVVVRIADAFRGPFEVAADTPWFGHGIGLGTVAGARLMTGKHEFLLSESELTRIVLELGPLLGFAFILWRAWLTFKLIRDSWNAVLIHRDSLPWLVTAATFYNVLWGQWGPATQLGFAVFGAGLVLAALNAEPDHDSADQPENTAGSATE